MGQHSPQAMEKTLNSELLGLIRPAGLSRRTAGKSISGRDYASLI
jgi:hypothetical protein